MDELLTGDVWRQVARRLPRATKKLVAIAYVTETSGLRLRRDDVVVCDASDQAIKSGETSAKELRLMFRNGVKLYSCPGLHAKVLVCGSIAAVGPSNLSLSSAHNLIEAAILTRRFQVRSQVRAFIHRLVESSMLISHAFVKRAITLPVQSRMRRGTKRRRLEEVGHRTWISSTVPIGEPRSIKERELAATGEKMARRRTSDPKGEVYSIRWSGKSRFRATAKEGDSVIEFSRNKKRTRCSVASPRPILMRQDADNWTRFYLEDHPDQKEIPWGEFQRILIKSGIRGIKSGTTRELAAREVATMESLWVETE